MMHKVKMLAIPAILVASLILVGCSNNQVTTQSVNTTTYQATDFLKYKGSYVGDNSAVGNLVSLLPAHDYFAGFSLQTEQKPDGITVHYKRINQA